MEFLEEKGQAEAADTLMLALLVGFSSFLIVTYGLGSYQSDVLMRALEQRHAQDFCQSYTLTASYVSASLDYPIEFDEVSKAARAMENIAGKSPLQRKVKKSVIELIGEDIFLIASKNKIAENFHAQVEEIISKDIEFFSGGIFNYKIEARYESDIITYNAKSIPKPGYSVIFSIPVKTGFSSKLSKAEVKIIVWPK